jgi:hypothetical protein
VGDAVTTVNGTGSIYRPVNSCIIKAECYITCVYSGLVGESLPESGAAQHSADVGGSRVQKVEEDEEEEEDYKGDRKEQHFYNR